MSKNKQSTSETNQSIENSNPFGESTLDQLASQFGHKSTDTIKEYLTSVEAADFLRVKVGTIHKYSYKNTIRHSKIGKRLRFKIEDLIEWVNKGYRTSA